MKAIFFVYLWITLFFTTACHQKSNHYVSGTVSITSFGTYQGCGGIPIYIFTQQQVKSLIANLTEKLSRIPLAHEVFESLPYETCIATGKTEVKGSRFAIEIDQPGDYILAVDAHQFERTLKENGKWYTGKCNCYWLFPYRYDKNNQSMTINLSEKNTVNSNIPNQIYLKVPMCRAERLNGKDTSWDFIEYDQHEKFGKVE